MKANDMYAKKSLGEDTTLYYLKGNLYDHIPEVNTSKIDYYLNTKICVKIVENEVVKKNCIKRTGTVWFEDKPFMIIQNGGEDGEYDAERYITNVDLYKAAVNYLLELFVQSVEVDIDLSDVLDPDLETESFENFYIEPDRKSVV